MLALVLLLSAATAALALWLWLNRDRKYQSSESVAAAYDAWTDDRLLERLWGDHVHLGHYGNPPRHHDFREAKAAFVHELVRWSGLDQLPVGSRVLDVGCGNGYHCWRMLGSGAAEVVGIDPTPLFILQFKAVQHYLQQPGIHVLPMTLEAMPEHLPVFDTVFSMGVLYHRRDPM